MISSSRSGSEALPIFMLVSASRDPCIETETTGMFAYTKRRSRATGLAFAIVNKKSMRKIKMEEGAD
jgi:hypothetical protein